MNWSKRMQEILESEDFANRIGELAAEAGRAGDLEQVRLCELALGCGDEGVKAPEGERRAARDECARVLANVEEVTS